MCVGGPFEWSEFAWRECPAMPAEIRRPGNFSRKADHVPRARFRCAAVVDSEANRLGPVCGRKSRRAQHVTSGPSGEGSEGAREDRPGGTEVEEGVRWGYIPCIQHPFICICTFVTADPSPLIPRPPPPFAAVAIIALASATRTPAPAPAPAPRLHRRPQLCVCPHPPPPPLADSEAAEAAAMCAAYASADGGWG